MKFVALRNFRNTGGKIKIDKAENANHVHKGAVFEIGTAQDAESLQKEDPETAKFVWLLNHGNCIGDGNDAKLVKMIQAEAAAEKAAEDRRFKATDAPRYV